MKENDTLFFLVWNVNPFRGDRFEEAWRPVARMALDFGATSWAFLRSNEDPLQFMQMATFDSKLEFERYWFSEEVAEARAEASGLFQVPVVPLNYRVVGAGNLTPAAQQG